MNINYYNNILGDICKVLNCRLFIGTPCIDMLSIYKSMSPDILHYIPLTSTKTAIGVANGAYITGNTAVVLADSKDIHYHLMEFNIKNRIPIFILTSRTPELKNKELMIIDCKNNLKKLCRAINNKTTKIINVLVVGECGKETDN